MSCSKPAEIDKEVYQGHLPGYGTTELAVLKIRGTDEVCVQLRSDLYDSFRLHEICGVQYDGEHEFVMARTAGGMGWMSRAYKDFRPIEQAAQTALAMRGTYLQRVK